jgi:transposase-like protein
VTDAVIADMQEWQSRPLDSVYPVLPIDAIVINIHDGHLANRPVYVAMGITVDGERDVLWLWAGPTRGGEGAKQWMSMLTELRNAACPTSELSAVMGQGLPDAIAAIWPLATTQTCVVHLEGIACGMRPRPTGRRSPPASRSPVQPRPSRRPSSVSASPPAPDGASTRR